MQDVTVEEIVAAAQALTQDRRRLDGLLSEVADAYVIESDGGGVFVELSSDLFSAIQQRRNQQ